MDFITLSVFFLFLCATNPYILSVVAIKLPGSIERLPLIELIRTRSLAVELFPSFFENSVLPEQLVLPGESPYEVYENQNSESTVVSYSVFLTLYNILIVKNRSSKEKIIKALKFHSKMIFCIFLSYVFFFEAYLLFYGTTLTYFGLLVAAAPFITQIFFVTILTFASVLTSKLLWRFGHGRLSYTLAALLDG